MFRLTKPSAFAVLVDTGKPDDYTPVWARRRLAGLVLHPNQGVPTVSVMHLHR